MIMTEYLKSAFEDLFRCDGLLVLARGLGIKKLFAKFVYFYCSQQKNPQNKRLIFCINASDYIDYVNDALLSFDDHLPSHLYPKVISNEILSVDRSLMYLEGGCFFITSRILIVDMLDGKIDPSVIGGLLIGNAHK